MKEINIHKTFDNKKDNDKFKEENKETILEVLKLGLEDNVCMLITEPGFVVTGTKVDTQALLVKVIVSLIKDGTLTSHDLFSMLNAIVTFVCED